MPERQFRPALMHHGAAREFLPMAVGIAHNFCDEDRVFMIGEMVT
jgi:hypothetical protein